MLWIATSGGLLRSTMDGTTTVRIQEDDPNLAVTELEEDREGRVLAAVEGHQTLGTIELIVSQSVDEMRSISRNLHPYQLDRLGLTKTIRTTVRQVSEASGMEITAEVADVDGLLPAETEINIYRIVQEALNNVVKHSQASRAAVVVTRERHTVVVEIDDDGRGFDREELRRSGDAARCGFGLRGMEERTRIAGGKAHYHSVLREGTRLRFEFPFGQEA